MVGKCAEIVLSQKESEITLQIQSVVAQVRKVKEIENIEMGGTADVVQRRITIEAGEEMMKIGEMYLRGTMSKATLLKTKKNQSSGRSQRNLLAAEKPTETLQGT